MKAQAREEISCDTKSPPQRSRMKPQKARTRLCLEKQRCKYQLLHPGKPLQLLLFPHVKCQPPAPVLCVGSVPGHSWGAGQQQELCFLGSRSHCPSPSHLPPPPLWPPHQVRVTEIPDQEITGCASCKANPMTSQRALTGLWDGRDPWLKFHAFHCAGVSFDEQNSPVWLANVCQ